MSGMEKYKDLFKWTGCLCCLLSILLLAALFLSPRYSAKITKASDIYYTRRATRSRDRNWQEVKNRLVSVEYEKGTADDILIKRQRNEKMPDVGDIIIVCSFPQVREYDPARTVTLAAAFAVYGAADLFYYLATAAGLDARITWNDIHAWNFVKVDGKYYYLDATWDLGVAESDYQYFLKGSRDFVSILETAEYSAHRPSIASFIGTGKICPLNKTDKEYEFSEYAYGT